MPPETWTDELLLWDRNDDRRRRPRGKADWIGLIRGETEGPLAGGCLATIDLLCGTPYMPDLTGHVLFLEDEGISCDKLCAFLTSLKQRGILDNISGLIIGRISRPNLSDSPGYQLKTVARECLGNLGIPVAWGVDLGHTEPMLTLPIGIKASLSVTPHSVDFSLLEGAVL